MWSLMVQMGGRSLRSVKRVAQNQDDRTPAKSLLPMHWLNDGKQRSPATTPKPRPTTTPRGKAAIHHIHRHYSWAVLQIFFSKRKKFAIDGKEFGSASPKCRQVGKAAWAKVGTEPRLVQCLYRSFIQCGPTLLGPCIFLAQRLVVGEKIESCHRWSCAGVSERPGELCRGSAPRTKCLGAAIANAK